MVDHPGEWKAVRRAMPEILGERLSRPPRGFDRQHPLAEDLKFKDFYVMTNFTQEEVCASDFLDRYMQAVEAAAPLVRFVTRSLDLKW
jgi:uncharacterized protein (DUF2461 family)